MICFFRSLLTIRLISFLIKTTTLYADFSSSYTSTVAPTFPIFSVSFITLFSFLRVLCAFAVCSSTYVSQEPLSSYDIRIKTVTATRCHNSGRLFSRRPWQEDTTSLFIFQRISENGFQFHEEESEVGHVFSETCMSQSQPG